MKFLSKETADKLRTRARFALYIFAAAVPILSAALFYILRPFPAVMDWASESISAPIRGYLGLLSSVFRAVSMMEVLGVAAVIWLIYHIAKTVWLARRSKYKLKIISQRLIAAVLVIIFVWSAHCWLWESGHYGTGFAAKNGFTSSGATVEELAAAAELFLKKANELAPQVSRDEGGHWAERRADYFASSRYIYHNLMSEFPSLGGRTKSMQYRPKPMLFSWLMSRTGFTGIYFALTGEANININAPGCLIPATVAHELAHQLGVNAEAEANFVAIAACITSGDVVYEYSGYLMGLMHLLDALYEADYAAFYDIHQRFAPELRQDWTDDSEYWQAQNTDTGIGAAGAADRRVGAGDRGKRIFDRLLHRKAIGLPLPADEAAAVIFNRELVARHQSPDSLTAQTARPAPSSH